MVDNGFFNLINNQNISKIKKITKKNRIFWKLNNEDIDVSKIREKNDSPQTKKLSKIYQLKQVKMTSFFI